MLLKAHWIVPVSSPPIENGVVVVEGDRITFVGAGFPRPGAEPAPPHPIIDLGDATLLPGLVNAHCHLEFSLPSPLPLPQGEKGTVNFTEWVKQVSRVVRGKGVTGPDLTALLKGGTTTVADHCNPETPRFETPFRRIIFWEVLGANKERAEVSLKRATLRAEHEGGFVTPHSLYGVHREILEKIFSVGAALRGRPAEGNHIGLPLQSIHLLESPDEDQFLRTGSGPLADYVKERGGHVPFPGMSPLSWLIENASPSPQPSPTKGEGVSLLLVHGNYLNRDEIAALRRLNTSVIHCPGSHRFFGHRRFPLEDLKQAGVPIALGTDSLASNNDLSMLREMRLLKESYPELDEAVILKMATLEGARALGMEDSIGSIEAGKKADLIAVRGSVLQAKEVLFSMIDGQICLSP